MAPERNHSGTPDLDAIGLPAFAYVRRGYDPDQVVAHLANVQAEIEELRTYAGQLEDTDEQLRVALDDADREIADLQRQMDEQLQELLKEHGKKLVAPAREKSEALIAKANDDAERILADVRSRAEKLQAEAERRAKTRLRQADEEVSSRQRDADQILRRAQEQADHIRTEARNAADEMRREAERVRTAAHAEAEQVRTAAHAEAEALQADAELRAEEAEESGRERAAELIARGEDLFARAQAKSEEVLEQARAEAAELLELASTETDELLERAHLEAEQIATTAHERSAELLADTHETCDRLLADLAAERDALRAEVDQLTAGRDQLLDSYHVVRETYLEAVAALEGVQAEIADAPGYDPAADAAATDEIERRRAAHRRAAGLDDHLVRGDGVIVIDDAGDAAYEIGTVGVKAGGGPEVPPPGRRVDDDADEAVPAPAARHAAATSPHAAPVGRKAKRRSAVPAAEAEGLVIPPVARRAPDPVEFQGRFSSAVRVLPPTPGGDRPAPTSPLDPMVAPDDEPTAERGAEPVEPAGPSQLVLPSSLDEGAPAAELQVEAAVESVTILRPEAAPTEPAPDAPRPEAPKAKGKAKVKGSPAPATSGPDQSTLPPPPAPSPSPVPAPEPDDAPPIEPPAVAEPVAEAPAPPVVEPPAPAPVPVAPVPVAAADAVVEPPVTPVDDGPVGDPADTDAVLQALATTPRQSAFLHAPLRGVTGEGVAMGTKESGGERHPWWVAPPLTAAEAPPGPLSSVELVTALVQTPRTAAATTADEPVDPETEVRRRCDVVVTAARRTLRRRLKGMLADDQNEILDALRQVKVGVPPSEGIIPEPTPHRERFLAAAYDGLRSAAEAGRDLAGELAAEEARRRLPGAVTDAGGGPVDGPGTALDDVASWLADELLEVLRARLLACFPTELMVSEDKKVDHARRDEVQNAIRSVYRRLKAGRVDTLIERASVEVVYRSVRDHLPPGVRPGGIEPLDLFRTA